MAKDSLSIVIPAKNEARSLCNLLPNLRNALPNDIEIIVVDDGSVDETANICVEHGVSVISHPYSKGNGAAIKTGARAAHGDIILFMDADGQHKPSDIDKLIVKYRQGFDMVVGARSHTGQASRSRALANRFYNKFASWVSGHTIKDLTSGFRVVNRLKFLEFLHLLPNGFSYPTTITMAFFRTGYSVGYETIDVRKRLGNSHISPLKDGIRFLLIIFKIGTLYSPLKIFFPTSFIFFITGISYYSYTYLSAGRFTNMSALLLSFSIIIFLIGLISEQITNLTYQK